MINSKFQNFALYNAHHTTEIYLDDRLYNSGGSYFYNLTGIMVDGSSLGEAGRYFIIAKLISTNDPQVSSAYVSSDKLLKYVHIGNEIEYGWSSF